MGLVQSMIIEPCIKYCTHLPSQEFLQQDNAKSLSNHMKITMAISKLDFSNLTALIDMTVTANFSDLGILSHDHTIEGVSINDILAHNSPTIKNYFNFSIPVLSNSFKRVTLSVPLFGDPSRFPFDHYNVNLLLAIPRSSLLNLMTSSLLNSSWVSFTNAYRADKNSIIITSLMNHCDSNEKIKETAFCSPRDSRGNSMFFSTNVNFERNYTIIPTVIWPLIGVFYLLGAVFALDMVPLRTKLPIES